MFEAESFNKNNIITSPMTVNALTKVKDLIIENIPLKNCKLLDIGTGDGKVLDEVILRQLTEVEFSTVTGSDFNEGMVELASRIYPNRTFKLLDIESENFDDNFEIKNSFDFLTSTFTFYLLKDIKIAFENSHKLLKTNGIFWCYFIGYNSSIEILLNFLETPKYSEFKDIIFDHLPPFLRDANFKENLPKMLIDCGYEILYLQHLSQIVHYPTKMNFINPVLSSFVRPFPDHLRQDLINDVVAEQEKVNVALGRNLYDVDSVAASIVVKKI